MKKYDPAYSEPTFVILEIDKDVKKGTMPSYDGETPFRDGDFSTTYTFKGWTPELQPVTSDIEYEAVFEGTLNKYTVTWKDDELNTLKEEVYEYGQIPEFGDDPIKENDAQYTYTFLGWSKSIDGEIIDGFDKVLHDVTYFARYDRLTNNYTVKWVNYDDALLQEETYSYGSMPSYKGATPYRKGNDIVDSYPFIGWDKEINIVKENVTYKATFDLLESPSSYFYFLEDSNSCSVTGLKYQELKTTLKRISIPSSYHNKPVTIIAATAFQGCTGVTTAVLPDTITRIDYGAFQNCSNLTSLTLNNGLKEIGGRAFYGTSKLEEIVIPDSVETISNNILEGSGIKKMTTPYIGSSKNEPKKFSYFGIYSTKIVTLTITEGCTELVQDVTDGHKVDIYLPHTIKTLPSICAKNLYYNGNIYDWEKITRHINDSITALYLKDGEEYSLLTEVNLQDGLTSISAYAFSGINSISSFDIGGTITKIDNYAFADCNSLTSAIVGDSVVELGDGVFSNTGLVSLELGKGVKKTGLSTFDTTHFENVYYDGTVEDYCNIEIKTLMFGSSYSPHFYIRDNNGDITYNNNKYSLLTELVIPDSITSIGDGQFYKFEQLTSVTFGSGVTSIGRRAFEGCTGLTTINVPSNVTELGWLAFGDCTSLTTATVSGVKTFNSTFGGCTKLEVINADVLETFNNYSFDENSVRRVNISNSETLTSDFGIIYDKGKKELKFCPRGYVGVVVVPEGVESIADNAFSDCHAISEIYLPSTLKSIGAKAFYACTSIDDLMVPGGVTSIGEEAFANHHYKNITLPFIGSSPTENKDFSYLFGKNGTAYHITITKPCTSFTANAFNSALIEEVTIPNTVTTLPQSIFKPCTAIKKLTLPFVGGSDTENNFLSYLFGAGVAEKYGFVPSSLKEVVITDATTIGDKAFYKQSNITSISLPDTVNSIGDLVLFECTGLVNLRIPFIGEVPDSTTFNHFAYIFGAKTDTSVNSYIPETLETVTLGNRITTLRNNAFHYINKLKHIVLSNSVTTIGEKCFQYCYGLEDITIPNSVTSIGASAFNNCTKLTTVVIGNGLTAIPETLFYNCKLLKTVTIGTNVTSIHSSAFNYCEALETIYFNAKHATFTGAYSPFKSMTTIKRVVFGDNVTHIEKGLFRACNQMVSLTFGASLISIGEYAFKACARLNSITYNGTASDWDLIIKGTGWNEDFPAGSKVICLKGNVKEVNL